MVLGQQQIDDFIAEERNSGGLPDLHGTDVWIVTGHSTQNRHDPDRQLQVRGLWLKYLAACGAKVISYSPVLIEFAEHAR